ncbi:hypothetical protein N7474_000772 [Penicillium riverlandense]|uniref:uncharacterized protein n=1 Tax=Penicillium riverlandense TaxID=1903569 RepID=UPI0025495BE9|nr:uncharacterized protein N7474_000772 [Penicillium riverlandense]KAJ5832461.1 hypothetical protein N7474_000772 [Penicillium riverlandense]
MAELTLDDLARQLSDIEVALWLSLVAREQCLIETTGACIHDLAKELALIGLNTFDISYSIVDCASTTAIDDICSEILTPESRKSQGRPTGSRMNTETSSNLSSYKSLRERSKSPIPGTHPDSSNVVNMVIAKNFNLISEDIQVQILELMRSRKLVTETAILNAPEDFLFVPLVVREGDQLHPPFKFHLNDHLFISHFHDPGNGYVYLEDIDCLSDGEQSASSVIRKSASYFQKKSPKVDRTMMDKLSAASETVSTSAEVVRYMQDIVVFLRLSRAVAGGVSAKASNHFSRFAQLLAPLHDIDYLTPSIVALAARKVFRHRVVVATPYDDRSLQYGSDMMAVSQVLVDVTPDSILDGVLALEPPL